MGENSEKKPASVMDALTKINEMNLARTEERIQKGDDTDAGVESDSYQEYIKIEKEKAKNEARKNR